MKLKVDKIGEHMDNKEFISEGEKRKISLSQEQYDMLLRDAEAFGFVKNDGTINKNRFLNTLIANYFDQYILSRDDLRKHYTKTLQTLARNEKVFLSESSINKAVYSMLDCMMNNDYQNPDIHDISSSIVFRPTREVIPIIRQIHSILGDGKYGRYNSASISGYLRSMISSYFLLPQDKREQILFKNIYADILSAMENENVVVIADTTGHVYEHELIWGVSKSQYEFFNYLLVLDEKGNPHSIRLSRISSISIEPYKRARKFSDEEKKMFERIEQNGAQFAYKEAMTIRVEFTEQGLVEYKKIYTNRPKAESIKDSVMTFSCSLEQAFYYFRRFGANALVLEPKELRDRLFEHYENAAATYSHI